MAVRNYTKRVLAKLLRTHENDDAWYEIPEIRNKRDSKLNQDGLWLGGDRDRNPGVGKTSIPSILVNILRRASCRKST